MFLNRLKDLNVLITNMESSTIKGDILEIDEALSYFKSILLDVKNE